MTETERLAAIEAIKALRARYFYCVDHKDWRGFKAVFAPDAAFDHSASLQAVDPISGASRINGREDLLAAIDTSGWKAEGRDQIVANSGQFADIGTVHQGFNPQIEILTEDTARGVWGMQDMLRFPVGSPISEIRGYGHYHETYRRIDGNWLIETTTLKRTRLDVE